jgi:hypothetical protein
MQIEENELLGLLVAAGALGESVAEDQEKRASAESRLQAEIGPAVDALIAKGFITEAMRTKAAAMLGDPAQAVALVRQVAERASDPGDFGGTPAGESKQATAETRKRASVSYVGQRYDPDARTTANLEFEKNMGIRR